MWKKLIANNEIMIQETVHDGMNCRIEARNNPEGWNIIKRYYAPEDVTVSYTEDYFRPTIDEAREAVKYLSSELLTKVQIKKIKDMKKSFNISIHRIYHEQNVEKWYFTVHSTKRPLRLPACEDGSVVIKYGETVEIDVMLKEKYKHFEAELIESINEKFGFVDSEKEVIHNFYYYVESTAYSTRQKKPIASSQGQTALLVR